MAGEVVTLQLGHYAGCVGAHWWGLQVGRRGRGRSRGGGGGRELRSHRLPSVLPPQRCPPEGTELSHAALLRAGRDGCTPRLIALELKGTGAADPSR